MGTGDTTRHHFHLPLHLHLPHLQIHKNNNIPKGCLPIMVGGHHQQHGGDVDGEEVEDHLQRFVIPLPYINHPLFLKLLKEAEDEYGFDYNGPIILPCEVDHFKKILQGLIIDHHHHNKTNHPHHVHTQTPDRHFFCFKP